MKGHIEAAVPFDQHEGRRDGFRRMVKMAVAIVQHHDRRGKPTFADHIRRGHIETVSGGVLDKIPPVAQTPAQVLGVVIPA